MRVVLEQVGQRLVVGQVVDADDLDVGARRDDGAEEVAADAAEAVDADADGHELLLPQAREARARCADGLTLSVRRVGHAGGQRSRKPGTKASAAQHVRGEVGLGVGDARGPRPACRPSRAAGGCARRSRPWSSAGRRARRAPRGSPACAPAAAGRPPQVVGDVVAEDLQGPLDPRAGGDRGPRRAAQVGVVEVGQPVGGGPHLAAHAPLLPGQHAVVRAEPGEQRADGVAVADDDPVDAADLAGLERRCRAGGRRRPARARPPARGR